MLGIFKRFLEKFKGRRNYADIDPDLIFMDSSNLPEFDTHQFQGRLEKPISNKTFNLFGFICLAVALIFLLKIGSLQVLQGAEYRERSDKNKLRQNLLVAPRGIIMSRDGKKLAWNEIVSEENFPARQYINQSGFGVLLGFVKYPSKDSAGFYYLEEIVSKDGLELYLNEILAGRNGLELIETAVDGGIVSASVIEPPKSGENATLSIDAGIQAELYRQISELAGKVNFQGGAGVIMDVDSGEILTLVSYPEYDPEIMTIGEDIEKIENYFTDQSNPFLNRVVSGLYAPGSIIKPFLAFAALEEGIITPEKKITSTGSISIPNPYFPDQPSIFKDWKAHGAVDMRRAIAVSSDVYFYEIGGGYGNQEGLGIERIKKYLENFGFSKITGFNPGKEATGLIPDPEWKEKTFDGEIWRLGDTYNTAIGQYGMQITPLQAVVATAALANGGKLLAPSILFTATSTVASGQKVDGSLENFEVVKEGMWGSVHDNGTAAGLNTSAVSVAAKTGTAEIGSRKQFVNSWVIGFFPYEKPKYAFAVVMERGPASNLIGATYVMRQTLDWMAKNKSEYFSSE